ncbi:hypothetical protein HIM_04220 [Hirsutella minnesotensis 3608]|uniref:SigF-like NTF2-like domain-containing protein n=1 Tax=Hirsutella minnesotensis 3608 TaxID=1043627 RepID=A0A0F7ZLK0_9HYPO|nr:hypothetical protein HIM_04220 [Hirsutella minnesotensis 3608]
MEHPVREIGGVITTLCTGNPSEQTEALETYFLSNATFTHPFCRVPSFFKGTVPFAPNLDSRRVILFIYQWYRFLSPHVDITIDSAVFDQRTGQLFVSIRQIMTIWFLPFYKAPVSLVTVLQLRQRVTSPDASRESAALAGPGQERTRYFIASQEDLYQFNDCVQFVLPRIGPFFWNIWQLFATFLCIVGAILSMPLFLFLNRNMSAKKAL